MEDDSLPEGPVPQLFEKVPAEEIPASDASDTHRYTVLPISRGSKRPIVRDESVAAATDLVILDAGKAPSGWTPVPFKLHSMDRQIKYLEAYTAASQRLAEALKQLTETCLSHRPKSPPFPEAYGDRCWRTALSIMDMQTYGIDILQQSLFHLQDCRRTNHWATKKEPQIVESVNHLLKAHQIAELYEELDRSCMVIAGQDYRSLETTLRAVLSEKRKFQTHDPRVHADFWRRVQSRQTEDLEQKRGSLAQSLWDGEIPAIIAELKQSPSSNLTLTSKLRNWVLTMDPDWTPPRGSSIGIDDGCGAQARTTPSSRGKERPSGEADADGTLLRRYSHPQAGLVVTEAPPGGHTAAEPIDGSEGTEGYIAGQAAVDNPDLRQSEPSPTSTHSHQSSVKTSKSASAPSAHPGAKQRAGTGSRHKVKRRQFFDLSESGAKTELHDSEPSGETRKTHEETPSTAASLTAAPKRPGGRGVVNSRRARQHSEAWPKNTTPQGTTSSALLATRQPLVGPAISASGPIPPVTSTSAAGRSDGPTASCRCDQTNERATMGGATTASHGIIGDNSKTYSSVISSFKPDAERIVGGGRAADERPSQMKRCSDAQSLEEAAIPAADRFQLRGQHCEGAARPGPSRAESFGPPSRWETMETQVNEVFDDDGHSSGNESAITDYDDDHPAVSTADGEPTPAAYVPGQSSLSAYFGLERERTSVERQKERRWDMEANGPGRTRSLTDIRDILDMDTEAPDELAETSQRFPRGGRWSDSIADGFGSARP